MTNLPNDGSTIYVALRYRVGTNAFVDINTSYISGTSGGSGGTPAVTSPTSGSTINGSFFTLNWTANGQNITDWWVFAGASSTAYQSDDYFNKRPTGSRFSAAASPQSQVIESQQWLTDRTSDLQNKCDEKTLKRPDNWGGYKLLPDVYEFWQGRPSRQHDRFRFTRNNSKWQIDRLAP